MIILPAKPGRRTNNRGNPRNRTTGKDFSKLEKEKKRDSSGFDGCWTGGLDAKSDGTTAMVAEAESVSGDGFSFDLAGTLSALGAEGKSD